MHMKSSKRTYTINLKPKLLDRTVRHLMALDKQQLQAYIDENFKKASALGGKNSSGAWAEAKQFRDKAKLAILFMDDYGQDCFESDPLGWLYV